MRFRIAKKSDIKMLSKLHFEAGKIQPNGYMYKLGLPFLKTYYKLLVNEKNSLVKRDGSLKDEYCDGTTHYNLKSIPLIDKEINNFVTLLNR